MRSFYMNVISSGRALLQNAGRWSALQYDAQLSAIDYMPDILRPMAKKTCASRLVLYSIHPRLNLAFSNSLKCSLLYTYLRLPLLGQLALQIQRTEHVVCI
jgi:hypothetical protein